MQLVDDKTLQWSWRSVVSAYQVCSQKYAVLMKHFDLTPSQFDVLLAVESLGKQATPKRIAEHLLVTKGNITGVTKRLLERNVVQTTLNAEDARSIHYVLTESGQAIVSDAQQAGKRFIREQLAPFSEDEIEKVGTLMQQMRIHLEKMDIDTLLTNTPQSIAREKN